MEKILWSHIVEHSEFYTLWLTVPGYIVRAVELVIINRTLPTTDKVTSILAEPLVTRAQHKWCFYVGH